MSKDIEPLPVDEKKALFKNIKDLTYYKISGLLVNSTDNILITFLRDWLQLSRIKLHIVNKYNKFLIRSNF